MHRSSPPSITVTDHGRAVLNLPVAFFADMLAATAREEATRPNRPRGGWLSVMAEHVAMWFRANAPEEPEGHLDADIARILGEVPCLPAGKPSTFVPPSSGEPAAFPAMPAIVRGILAAAVSQNAAYARWPDASPDGRRYAGKIVDTVSAFLNQHPEG